VRLMSDGDRLAGFMTNEWVDAGGDRYRGEYTKETENPFLLAKYGADWRETHQKVSDAWEIARVAFDHALSQGGIAGEGRYEGESRRPITAREWEEDKTIIRDNKLLSTRYFPQITDVLVKAADVRLQCRKIIERSNPEMLAPAPDDPPKAAGPGIAECSSSEAMDPLSEKREPRIETENHKLGSEKKKGGGPPRRWVLDSLESYVVSILEKKGDFVDMKEMDSGWRAQNDLIKRIRDRVSESPDEFYLGKDEEEKAAGPARSTVERFIRPILVAWRAKETRESIAHN
jgi:hypothetical protein